MKDGLIKSYVNGITDTKNGVSYNRIIRYFIPEFITALVLYSLLYLLDAWFIADLKSTSMFATLGVTNTLLHFIVKVAESFSVGTIVLTGNYNGAQDYKKAGATFVDAFWVSLCVGVCVSFALYFGAYWIYYFFGVPEAMIGLGIPFLRLRAISILCMFVYFAFIGFMRGIKNTKTPMAIFIIGAITFIFFDYVLIFGKFGFPKMALQGSAMATVIQYGVMLFLAVCWVFFSPEVRRYKMSFFSIFFDLSRLKGLLQLSWPVMLDKSTMAIAYIWLARCFAPMGDRGLAAFSVVKDLERFAFLPAVALAQVITFLVSNDYSKHNWRGIKTNIKKIVSIASFMVFSILLVISLKPYYFISFFDKNGDFTEIAARALPLLSVLVFFDLLQLLLSGAMRGASNVKIVMFTRLVICFGYFIPVSYQISRMNFSNDIIKFVLLYGAFYVGNGLMSIVYIYRFRGQAWKKAAKQRKL